MTYYRICKPFLKVLCDKYPIPRFKGRGNHAGIYPLREGELFTEREVYILGLPLDWVERVHITGETFVSMGVRYQL